MKYFAAALFLLFSSAVFAQQSTVKVDGAWARSTPPGAKTAAAYMTITSSQSDRLLSVSTPVAGEADLHKTVNENGVMKMSPAGALALNPNEPVVLSPGGSHLMMMDLKQPLTDGQSFPLTLVFEKAGKIDVSVPVRRTAPSGAASAAMPMSMAPSAPVIVSPKDGEMVSNPVRVVVEMPKSTMGHDMGQGTDHDMGGHMHGTTTGHIHLIVDAAPPKPGTTVPVDKQHIHLTGGPKATLTLAPGKHTLQAIVGTMDHKVMDAAPSERITITVK